ncbi:MAG: glycosyltransferase family 2 protein [Treponema sp.]|jgi:chlorobactene glucosyltransferase|nr:glycosyltransferase family 2 protein [Treponema sp.]
MFNWLSELLSPFYYDALIIVASYFFFLSLANHYEMWRFTLATELFDGPLVSVLVPARNEERNIERCLNSLRNQVYKNFEILVLNDNSTDNTAAILDRIAASDSRVRVFSGTTLPEDWYGKPFALHQLTQRAKGEIFIFTDADTVHGPTGISWAVSNMLGLKADMISGYIGQIFGSFGEVITVPLMYFLTGFIIPLFMNRRFMKIACFSAAVGQFIVIRSDVFRAIGGCESFKKKTSEDIYMARYVKKMGYSTRFLNITDHVKCRMYNGYRSAVEGIGKNVFDFLGKNTLVLFLMAAAVFFFLFFPFPLLFFCAARFSPWTPHILIVVILYTLTWIFMFLNQRLNWWYGFLWPLLFLNLLYMAAWSWFRTISGRGFLWKDRVVR